MQYPFVSDVDNYVGEVPDYPNESCEEAGFDNWAEGRIVYDNIST